MTATTETDLPPEIAAWIGRRTQRTDTLSPRLVDAFRATMAGSLAAGAGAPLGVHWCLAPDSVEPRMLGADGHPRTGLFLPALPYPRRMWAGGELAFHADFAPGDTVLKTTTVADIAFKAGRSGRLAFVTIRHAYHVADRLVLDERQDVVYRDAEGSGSSPARRPAPDADAPMVREWAIATDPTLLFRYSALTFNGHRIHYDQPYATDVERYDGLVVHGPMQGTLLLNLAADVLRATPARFAYRGVAPLICGRPARACALAGDHEPLRLRVLDDVGAVTMTAEAGGR